MRKLFFSLICCVMASLSLNAASPKWALKDAKSNSGFHDGKAVFRDYDTKLYGAIGSTGVVEIRPQFKKMEDFKNGVSVVQMPDGKYGIINTRGAFLLAPIYDKIDESFTKPGVYVVESDYSKHGVFANGRLVVPVEYGSVYEGYYPFIRLDSESLNIMTGEKWQGAMPEWHLMKAYDYRTGVYKYYYKDGTPVKDGVLSDVSSKGLKLEKDTVSGKYILKNVYTGEVLSGARYTPYSGAKWVNDAIILTEEGDDMVMIDAGGEILLKSAYLSVSNINYDDEFYEIYGSVVIHDNCEGLYTVKGEVIIPPNTYKRAYHESGCWFEVETENGKWLLNVKTKQEIKDYKFCSSSEGMLLVATDSGYYYVNSETGERLPGMYKYAYKFSEGVARVNTEGNEYFDIIDKKGKVILAGSAECDPSGDCSEGVIPARYEREKYGYMFTVNGYIHNPLGNKKYKYNQKSASRDVIREWWDKGYAEFNKGNYSKAKEYFYRIMMAEPFDVAAVSNYGACLNNMGYYEEAILAFETALEIDPNYEHAQKELQRTLKNKQAVINSREVVAEENKTGTFWDALSAFGQVLESMGTSVNNSGYSYGTSGYSSGKKNQNLRQEKGSDCGVSWRADSRNYSDLESRLIKGCDESEYRSIQARMRSIRQKWTSKGCHITKSSWEDKPFE